jgi:hypothetical protein
VNSPFDTGEEDAAETDGSSVPEAAVPEVSPPEVSPPEVSAPEPPSPDVDYEDADTGLKVLFWKLVLLYKAAILGTSLGALFLVFEPGSGVGLPLFVGGVGLLGYTLYQTRRGKQRIDAGEFDTEGDGRPDDGVDTVPAEATAQDGER